jgi:hypothetical protein
MGVSVWDRVLGGMNMLMGVRVSMAGQAVGMNVEVEVSAITSQQQSRCQRHDDEANHEFGRSLQGVGQEAPEQDCGETESDEGGRVPQAPGEAQRRGPADAVSAFSQEQGGNRREMIGIGRVPETKEGCHDVRHGPAATQLCQPLIESEHAVHLGK